MTSCTFLIVPKAITSKKRFDLEIDEIEAFWIEVTQKIQKLRCWYGLQTPGFLPTNLLADALIAVNETFIEVILMGDINASYRDKSSCKELKCVLSSNGFK